jgi:general secretion pathway protein K
MNNKGSVLIFILIFIAFSLGVVTVMHQRAGNALTSSSFLQFEHQSSIYAMSAVEAVRELLEDDDNSYDYDGEIWAILPPFPVPNGFITITVEPVNGRLSLNRIEGDNSSENYFEACKKTLTTLTLDEFICASIKDWIDTDGDTSSGGEENFSYLVDGKSYKTKNGKLETLRELYYINGAKENIATLQQHFTNEGEEKLNLNFVTREALIGMVPDLENYADSIISYRTGNIYKNVSNLLDAATMPTDIYNTSLRYLGVKSSLFYVKTEVSLNDKSRFYHILIRRDGSRTSVVKYIEGNDGIFF